MLQVASWPQKQVTKLVEIHLPKFFYPPIENKNGKISVWPHSYSTWMMEKNGKTIDNLWDFCFVLD